MSKSFVHLHAHTEYSMLDGAAKINDYLKKVKELNQPAAAITDHGNLYGALEFVRQAETYGIKPIIGYEAYVTPGSRFEKPDRDKNKRYHLTLLAENNIGYQNLVELVSRAYLEGFYYKPRVDYELLRDVSKNSNIPVIGAGGAKNIGNIVDIYKKTNVSALAIGSLLHKNFVTIREIKKEINFSLR